MPELIIMRFLASAVQPNHDILTLKTDLLKLALSSLRISRTRPVMQLIKAAASVRSVYSSLRRVAMEV